MSGSTNIWINKSWRCEVCGCMVNAAKNKKNQYKARCRHCGTVMIKDAAGLLPDRIFPLKKKITQ